MPTGLPVLSSKTPAARTLSIAELAERPDPEERFSEEDWAWIRDGVPYNTWITYRRQWLRWLKWCGAHGYCELPATPATVVKFIRANWRMPGRYKRPMAPASIKLTLAVISVFHQNAARPDLGKGVAGYPSPCTTKPVELAFRSYSKKWLTAGHRPDTAYPIAPEELAEMVATLDVRSTKGLRDAAVLALDYDLGARRAEVCSLNLDDIEWHIAGDQVTADDWMIVHIPMSKTDQDGEGDDHPIKAHPDEYAATCPVRLVYQWVQLCQNRGFHTGPLFRKTRGGGPAPSNGQPKNCTVIDARMPDSAVGAIVKWTSEAAGLTDVPGRRRHIVAHSLRAGAATEAARLGIPVDLIYDWFRWSRNSPTGMKYMRQGRRRGADNLAGRIWQRRKAA